MKIKDIFAKDIDRNIRGVIKIGQDEEPIKKQELEEYVVTDELRDNFTRFFEAYSRGIGHVTDEMGVWISGFFGSGKSHFLKILSYLLENDEVAGKRAIDYFRDDNKFNDDHTLELMEQAEKVPTDVVLFNIDAKADANSARDNSAILTVFLKVFNERLGYSPEPALANMERWLDDNNKYTAFQEKIETLTGKSWREIRNTYAFISDTIEKALVQSGAMTEENAHGFIQSVQSGNYDVTPESFAKLVRSYLDKKGNDHHIVFLVDEVGQFIGDDGTRMLNLQGIVEQLGVECQGRAWVIVTSQQQMDEVTTRFDKQDRDDFSKIQGRFNTMITMSSANADEVIQKRLLDKTPRAMETLTDVFNENEHNINNKIDFSDRIERMKFNDADSFVTNYPFVPYQFKLLKDVLRVVRKHGAEGKHMSDGERSMLATFQEATRRYEHDEVGKLVPFNAFFHGMQEFLSHDHQVVFAHAKSDELLNPSDEAENINLQVLQVLFMVKYLDDFPATITNITTLLINDINADRRTLTENIERSLKKLEQQNYILKNVDTYEFLTDKEQEVNQTINSYEVSDDEVVSEIGAYLVGGNHISIKYSYPRMNNRYIFNFNAYIDGKGFGRTANELSIRIVTPLDMHDESEFISMAQMGHDVVIVLPDNDNYIDNYRRADKIKQYLQKPTTGDAREKMIRLSKGEERNAQREAANQQLIDALNLANIYVVDDVLKGGTDIGARLNEAFNKIINENYRRLDYIESGKGEKDIVSLLKGDADLDLEENSRAVTAVLDEINRRTGQGDNRISMANLRDQFAKIPYAYNDEDVAWLVAKLFMDGKLRLFYNGDPVELDSAKQNSRTVLDYLTNRRHVEKLTIQTVREVPKKQLDDAREYVRDVLEKKSILAADLSSEAFAMEIKRVTQEKISQIREDIHRDLPGNDLLNDGLVLLNKVANAGDSYHIFNTIHKSIDDLIDWDEDMDESGVWEFYASESQQQIWKTTQRNIDRYDEATGYIHSGSDNGVIAIVNQMKQLRKQRGLGKVVPQLNELNGEFNTGYSDLIDQVYAEYQRNSKEQLKVMKQRLADVNFPSSDNQEFSDKIEHCVRNHNDNARRLSDTGAYIRIVSEKTLLENDIQDLQRQIDERSRELAAKVVATPPAPKPGPKDNEPFPIDPVDESTQTKISRTVKISDIQSEPWRIQSKDELDQKLQSLRNELEKQLEDINILNVDFK